MCVKGCYEVFWVDIIGIKDTMIDFYNWYRKVRVFLGLVCQKLIKQHMHFNTNSISGMFPMKIMTVVNCLCAQALPHYL